MPTFAQDDDEEEEAPAEGSEEASEDAGDDSSESGEEDAPADDAGDDTPAPAADLEPKDGPQAGQLPPSDAKQDAMKAYLSAQGYDKAADNSGVKAAIANAQGMNKAANIGSAVEGLFRARGEAYGGKGVDQGFYDRMSAQGAQGVQQAQTARQQAIQDYLTKNDLGRQQTADSQKAAEFANWHGENAPGSPKALALVNHINSLFPKYTISDDDAKNLTVNDITRPGRNRRSSKLRRMKTRKR